MIQVRCVTSDEPRDEAWDAFLANVPGAGPFHLPAWRRALVAAHPRLQDHTLWIADGPELRAALPVLLRPRFALARAASQPYGTPGGTWLRDPADLEAAAALVREFVRRFDRPWNDCLLYEHGPVALDAVYADHWPRARRTVGQTHALELPATVEALEASWERRTRKAMRRAEALGLELEECSGESGLREFERHQARENLDRGKGAGYPSELLRQGLRAGWLRLFRATRGGRSLGVTAVAEAHGTWFAWLVAHSAEAREAPTGEFLFGSLLRDAVRRGVRTADLGSSSGRRGPSFFKEGFGATPRSFRVWRSGPLAARSAR